MKKITLIFGLMALLGSGYAQEGFQFGAGGGFYSAWIINQNAYGNPELEYATTTGNQFHLTAGYRFTENVGVEIAPGLTHTGQNYDGKMLGFDSERSLSLTYITLPVLFHFTSGGDVTRFHLMAGPQFCFLNKAEQEFSSSLPFLFMDNGDVSERFQSSDIMGVLDVGADFFLDDNLFINAGLRFHYGFTDINQEDWRLKNLQGEYDPSHNFLAGLNVGINYILD